MALQYENFYESTLDAAITDTDTYIPLVNPPSTATESYLLIDWDIPSKREFVYYTSKDSGGVNVTLPNRGVDGTAAIAHTKNAKVRMNLSAAMITDIINNVKQYPVGSIYTNASVATNPSDPSLLGYGTWAAFGAGRVPVGFDATQSEFNATAKTGGEKTSRHAYIEPGINTSSFQDTGHNYVASATSDIDSWLTGGGSSAVTRNTVVRNVGGTVRSQGTTGIEVRHARYTAPTLQPYITVYMWIRTA